ncbi:MAG: hypothetical protein GYB66_16340, partial [Chloroflexi bacterium]|nr:hypothetical protein [Chloroflexota bacterium]
MSEVVLNNRLFDLQRFYFGVFVQNGRAQSEPSVLARTRELSDDQISLSMRLARLEPPVPSQASDEMPSAIGLFRAQGSGHILAIAQITSAGFPQLLCLFLESQLVVALGGNLQPFIGLAYSEMPVFAGPRALKPFRLDQPEPLSQDEQYDIIQNMLFYCHDNMRVVQGLLSALIRGERIAILNAPPSLEVRLEMSLGLVSLLPAPARVILSLATNVIRPETSTAQVQFMAPGVMPARADVVFDWATGAITPPQILRHDFAAFVVSQLRLDPMLAIEQTEYLARTATWRAIRRDDVSTALHWVSRRAKVDLAVGGGAAGARGAGDGGLREGERRSGGDGGDEKSK